MNAISVQKVDARELSATMIFILKTLYNVESSDFTVIYDNKYSILYVNGKIPQKDIKRFMQMAGYEGKDINDPDAAVSGVVDYIMRKYGYSTRKILWDFQNERRRKKESEKAKEKAAEVYRLIHEYAMNEDNPDVFAGKEFLIYHLKCMEMDSNRKTVENMVGYSTKMVFLYGYLLGIGVITKDDTGIEDEEKSEYLELLHKYFDKMNAQQLKDLHYYANRILCSKQYC